MEEICSDQKKTMKMVGDHYDYLVSVIGSHIVEFEEKPQTVLIGWDDEEDECVASCWSTTNCIAELRIHNADYTGLIRSIKKFESKDDTVVIMIGDNGNMAYPFRFIKAAMDIFRCEQDESEVLSMFDDPTIGEGYIELARALTEDDDVPETKPT